jgi:hypothetical protein
VTPEPLLQHVVLDTTLWGIVLPPVFGALAAFAVALREERAPAGDLRRAGARRRVAVVAASCAALSFVLVLSRVARIAEMPESARVLADHVLRLARVGSFDANFDLAFDPLAAVAGGAVAFAGTVALALGARADVERAAQATGALSLAVAALLLACLASDAVVMLAALDLCVVALVVATARQSRLLRAALAGGALSLSGAAIVFWGLGGGWAGGEYTVDFSPRVVALRENALSEDDESDDTEGKASLTMVGHPGAVVFLDDARTPILDGDHALRSPFVRHEIVAGRHAIRVHAGVGTDDFVVPDALAAAGEEMTITWVGPTLSFREMRDSLGLRDARGRAAIREAFLAREFLPGVPLADAACLLLLLGAGVSALVISAAARRRGADLLGDAALLAIVWYVAARLDPLLAFAPTGRGFLALVACAAWLVATERVRRGGPASHALAALVLLGASARAAPFGSIVVLAGLVALASAALSLESRPSAVGASALAGAPIPLLGVGWGAFGIVDAAWTVPPGGRAGGVAIVLASLVGAFFLGASARGATKPGATRASLSLALAVVAAALGPLLGASRAWLGERGAATATRLLEPFVAGWANAGRSHEIAVALAWTGAALGGWAYARRRPRAAAVREPYAQVVDDEDEASGASRAGLDLVLGFDRWVVGATIGGAVNAARVVGWSVSRVGGALLEAPTDAAARAVRGAVRRSGVARLGAMLAAVATLLLAAWAAR